MRNCFSLNSSVDLHKWGLFFARSDLQFCVQRLCFVPGQTTSQECPQSKDFQVSTIWFTGCSHCTSATVLYGVKKLILILVSHHNQKVWHKHHDDVPTLTLYLCLFVVLREKKSTVEIKLNSYEHIINFIKQILSHTVHFKGWLYFLKTHETDYLRITK